MDIVKQIYQAIKLDQWNSFQAILAKPNGNIVSPQTVILSNKGNKNTCTPKSLNFNKLVNGETMLHLACRLNRIEMVQSILHLPNIDINVQDKEHHWTPLHRSLYHGHIRITLLLLSKKEINPTLVDKFGLTPFQLFAKTYSKFTLPCNKPPNDVLTWGISVYGVLGYHSKAEIAPELHRVSFRPEDSSSYLFRPDSSVSEIWDFAISKMHAVLVTSLGTYVWGQGSLGRLGFNNQNSLMSPTLLPSIKGVSSKSNKLCKVTVGRDHTVLLTEQHQVFGFGSNAHGQLALPQHREIILTPHLLSQHDLLKKEPFTELSTSDYHTALYYTTKLIMFGSNHGQMGIENKDLVWIEPRVIPCLGPHQTLLQVVCSNYATAILTNHGEVTLLSRYRTKKLFFPAHTPVLGPATLSDQEKDHQGWQTLKITTSQKVQHVALASDSGMLVGTAISSDGGYLYFWKKSDKPASSFPMSVIWSPVLGVPFAPVTSVVCGLDAQVVLVTVHGHVYINEGPHLHYPWRALFVSRVTKVITNTLGTFAMLKHRPDASPFSSNFFSHEQQSPPSQRKAKMRESQRNTNSSSSRNKHLSQEVELHGSNQIYKCPWSSLQSYPWFRTMRTWHPTSSIDFSLFPNETIDLWLSVLLQQNRPILKFEHAVSLLQLTDYFLMEDMKQYLAFRFSHMLSIQPLLLNDLLYLAYQYQLPSLLHYCEQYILQDPEGLFPLLLHVHNSSPFPYFIQTHFLFSALRKKPTLPEPPPTMHLPSVCFDSIKAHFQANPSSSTLTSSIVSSFSPFSNSSSPSSSSSFPSSPSLSSVSSLSSPSLSSSTNSVSSPSSKASKFEGKKPSQIQTSPFSLPTQDEELFKTKTIHVFSNPKSTNTYPSSSSSSSSSSSASTSSFQASSTPSPMPSHATWAEKRHHESTKKSKIKDFTRIEIESKFELALLREHKRTREFGSGEWITFEKLQL